MEVLPSKRKRRRSRSNTLRQVPLLLLATGLRDKYVQRKVLLFAENQDVFVE